ncbi:uncharacterized protein LOC110855380 isoform X2 [Folsomia candida]|nr:uncharacterized protein LOC110855380 isoform X2 [Folsomia candida]
MSQNSLLLLSVVPFLTQLTLSTGTILQATFLQTRLPVPDNCTRPYHFPWEDVITLFGSCRTNGNQNKDILRFRISTDTIEKVGELLEETNRGSVQADTAGNIYYLGGVSNWVQKYNAAQNVTERVTTFPFNLRDSTSVNINSTSNEVIVFGGYGIPSAVYSIDLDTFSTQYKTTLPQNILEATSVRVGDFAYIFDSGASRNNRQVMRVNLKNFTTEMVGPPTLPAFSLRPSSVYDSTGNKVYVIGGYTFAGNEGNPTAGIYEFDPVTFENRFIPVANFPVTGEMYWGISPAAVYVEGLDRIYFFGGSLVTSYSWYQNEIFYVSLAPLRGNLG